MGLINKTTGVIFGGVALGATLFGGYKLGKYFTERRLNSQLKPVIPEDTLTNQILPGIKAIYGSADKEILAVIPAYDERGIDVLDLAQISPHEMRSLLMRDASRWGIMQDIAMEITDQALSRAKKHLKGQGKLTTGAQTWFGFREEIHKTDTYCVLVGIFLEITAIEMARLQSRAGMFEDIREIQKITARYADLITWMAKNEDAGFKEMKARLLEMAHFVRHRLPTLVWEYNEALKANPEFQLECLMHSSLLESVEDLHLFLGAMQPRKTSVMLQLKDSPPNVRTSTQYLAAQKESDSPLVIHDKGTVPATKVCLDKTTGTEAVASAFTHSRRELQRLFQDFAIAGTESKASMWLVFAPELFSHEGTLPRPDSYDKLVATTAADKRRLDQRFRAHSRTLHLLQTCMQIFFRLMKKLKSAENIELLSDEGRVELNKFFSYCSTLLDEGIAVLGDVDVWAFGQSEVTHPAYRDGKRSFVDDLDAVKKRFIATKHAIDARASGEDQQLEAIKAAMVSSIQAAWTEGEAPSVASRSVHVRVEGLVSTFSRQVQEHQAGFLCKEVHACAAHINLVIESTGMTLEAADGSVTFPRQTIGPKAYNVLNKSRLPTMAELATRTELTVETLASYNIPHPRLGKLADADPQLASEFFSTSTLYDMAFPETKPEADEQWLWMIKAYAVWAWINNPNGLDNEKHVKAMSALLASESIDNFSKLFEGKTCPHGTLFVPSDLEEIRRRMAQTYTPVPRTDSQRDVGPSVSPSMTRQRRTTPRDGSGELDVAFHKYEQYLARGVELTAGFTQIGTQWNGYADHAEALKFLEAPGSSNIEFWQAFFIAAYHSFGLKGGEHAPQVAAMVRVLADLEDASNPLSEKFDDGEQLDSVNGNIAFYLMMAYAEHFQFHTDLAIIKATPAYASQLAVIGYVNQAWEHKKAGRTGPQYTEAIQNATKGALAVPAKVEPRADLSLPYSEGVLTSAAPAPRPIKHHGADKDQTIADILERQAISVAMITSNKLSSPQEKTTKLRATARGAVLHVQASWPTGARSEAQRKANTPANGLSAQQLSRALDARLQLFASFMKIPELTAAARWTSAKYLGSTSNSEWRDMARALAADISYLHAQLEQKNDQRFGAPTLNDDVTALISTRKTKDIQGAGTSLASYFCLVATFQSTTGKFFNGETTKPMDKIEKLEFNASKRGLTR